MMMLMTLRVPKWMIDAIENIVSHGLFSNKSEFIRDAIRNHIKRYEELAGVRIPEPVDGLTLHTVQIKVPEVLLEILRKRRISFTKMAIEETVRALLDSDGLTDEEAEKLLQVLWILKNL